MFMKKILLGLSLISVLGFIGYGMAHAVFNWGGGLTFPVTNNFEEVVESNAPKWEGGYRQLCCEHSAQISKEYRREGTNSVRFELNYADPKVKGSKRSELRLAAPKFEEDYWYRFSIFVPETWVDDKIETTVVQWHAVPEKIIMEGGRNPPLRIGIVDNEWVIDNFWDSRRITRLPYQPDIAEGYSVLWRDKLQKGTWVDWEFRIRWSYKETGIVEVWKNGLSIVTNSGPNTYNDLLAPYLKVGLYVPAWGDEGVQPKTKKREIYFDEVGMSNAPLTSP